MNAMYPRMCTGTQIAWRTNSDVSPGGCVAEWMMSIAPPTMRSFPPILSNNAVCLCWMSWRLISGFRSALFFFAFRDKLKAALRRELPPAEIHFSNLFGGGPHRARSEPD
jgi:hypothetical protein